MHLLTQQIYTKQTRGYFSSENHVVNHIGLGLRDMAGWPQEMFPVAFQKQLFYKRFIFIPFFFFLTEAIFTKVNTGTRC